MIFHLKPNGHVTGIRPAAAAFLPSGYDLLAFAILFGVLITVAHGARVMDRPLSALDFAPISLESVSLIP